MNEPTGKNFGLLIAYVLPGFIALWALQTNSSQLRTWLSPSPTLPAGLEAVVFVTAASIAAGMTLSAIRWLLIDTLHHCTGLPRPTWNDGMLESRINAFDMIVEAHFRYYQFYAHMALVVPLVGISCHFAAHSPLAWWAIDGIVLLEVLFLAASRDALRRYYARTSRLLGTLEIEKGVSLMTNGHRPAPAQEKSPAAGKPKQVVKTANKPSKPTNSDEPRQ